MKNTAYFLVFSGLIFASCENGDDIDISNYVLSSETRYVHGSTGIDTVTSYHTYEQGKLIKIEGYIPKGDRPISTEEFLYDENNRLLNTHTVSYDKSYNKFQETFYSYAYTPEGKISSKIIDSLIQYYGGPVTLKNVEQTDYQYDEQHRMVSIHTYSSMADHGINKFYYDNQSNLVKEERFSDINDTTPAYVIEFKSFDTHPNPFYTFMQNTKIPYHWGGYRYSPFNVLEEESLLYINSQKTVNTYEYEYGNEHDLPLKLYANGKLIYELTYEKLQ